MEVFVQGQGRVKLEAADFVAQGGEGAVYARGDTAYKVYSEPAKMLPAGKFVELDALTDPRILRPQAVLLDRKNRPIGYTMPYVPDGTPLCQLFTRGFRERKGITADRIVRLVERLREGVAHVHAAGMLIVDLNEMNFLLDAALREVLFIDVDSYQTPGYPATALMDSVRDRHSTAFSPLTDWFSFAVVSFQMFIGIHPYRGKHPTVAELDGRMRANLSVLGPDVSVPKVCYPFDVIPHDYREWYHALFEEGKRVPPPAGMRPVVVLPAAPAAPATGGRVRLRELARYPEPVLAVVRAGGDLAALTTAGLHFRGRCHAVGADASLAVTPRMGRLVAAWVQDGRLVLYDARVGEPVPGTFAAEAVAAGAGTLVVKHGTALYSVELLELPAGLRAGLRPIGTALPYATRLFDGAAVQSLPGAAYLSLFTAPGECRSVRVPELDRVQVLDARYEGRVLVLTGAKDGGYVRLVFRFNEAFSAYDVRTAVEAGPAAVNFAALDNGVCVLLTGTGELELFKGRPGSHTLEQVSDPGLPAGRLFADGAEVLFVAGSGVYRASCR